LNDFTLDYCDLTNKVIYSLWDHNAMGRNCSNFQILLDCIVTNGISRIVLHHVDLFYKMRYLYGTFKMIWSVAPNLEFCPRSGFSILFWVSGFFLKIWVF